MTAYQVLFDRVLTRIDAELAHQLGFGLLRAATPLTRRRRTTRTDRPVADVHAWGLTFPHPLGLAAGFDKNGVGIDALLALGFGHVEVGTVTAEPQPGNPRPRLFRLPADGAVVNRMGFNNDGAEAVARRLAARRLAARELERADAQRPDRTSATGQRRSSAHLRQVGGRGVVGVNIGKSKVVPEGDAAAVRADHEKSAGLLAPYADYLVVNVSSPNTPGLRDLQAVDRLEPILRAVRRRADEVTQAHRDRPVPLLVKIAPDLDDDDVLAVADLARAVGLDGVIATNTTISRDGLATDPARVAAVGAGGLSGPPLAARSLAVLRLLADRAGDALTLVAAGGITTAADAQQRLDSGATLLQAYTAFVYHGPRWPHRIVRALGAGVPGGRP